MSKKKFIVELDPEEHLELCEVIKNHGGVEAQDSEPGDPDSDPNSPPDKPGH
jgi:hypothetical protein